jgi:transcription antitermination factor NusG
MLLELERPLMQTAPVQFSYSTGEHWFAVYANIKSEYRARAGLNALGLRTFLPEQTKWTRHARMRKMVKRPLMTRYLFVELDPDRDSFEKVRQVDGVESIVSNCNIPTVIPREFIEYFLMRQLRGDFDYANKEPLTKGAKVKIVDGKWDEAIGIITGGSTAYNGSVMVKILNEKAHQRLGAYSVRALVR